MLDLPPWRQAWRSLARRPAFLATAVLTLAFGTGISAAVFLAACAALALCAATVAGPALKAGRTSPIEALRGE